ncbi:hypothetical protein M9H77_23121 [Catharanthus roseus]|uniref:Uncharacterized protein n=1 Tax=Catharanthus roseus TaxID=4058 RepID=A0ACC0AV44_CATRO|nr:hypothetical protein M9H77_23121 [Catharanthus roseus]
MSYFQFHLLLIIFLLPLFYTLAQNNGVVSVGSTLTAANGTSRPWISPSSDFAFGFRQVQDKDRFLLSIWYVKIPDTLVWFNNKIDPVPLGSTVQLAQTGLVLRDPQGRLVWRTENLADDVDHGFMNDTGNFIIKRRDNFSLWQSFDFPADTILPMQDLLPGGNSILISRKSETNFSRGRFYLQFLANGNLILTTRSNPRNREDDDEYYNSQTSDEANNGSASGIRVIFDERGSMHILRRNNEIADLTPSSSLPPATENYFRATLSFDGVFTHYYHPRTFSAGTPNWKAIWWQPDNICMDIDGDRGSGACGYNNVCRVGSFGRPICKCPKGYQLLDPNDEYGSCRPNFTLSCRRSVQKDKGSIEEDLYDFVILNDTNWPKSDFERLSPFSEIECRQACLEDCFCAVAIFSNSQCWKKKFPLSNGRIETNTRTIAFLKYKKGDIPNYPSPDSTWVQETENKSKQRSTPLIIVSSFLGGSVFINFLLITAVFCGLYLIYGAKKLKIHSNNHVLETNVHFFAYEELVEATNGFKEEIGRGSFGIVYKGVIKPGSKTVAVKKLDRVAQDTEKEFRAEIKSISQTHHKNLVRLLGFCDKGQYRLLVYEYISNGTLSSLLFTNSKPSWTLRIQIAIAIAKGLVYLHEECINQIIHCDIKPQNILLDEYYNAKISDFGLAKLLSFNQSRTHTNIRGTKGYVAPEWFRSSKVTSKVDVYSFGVLLLEIISCRKCLGEAEIEVGEYPILNDWVWDCFQEGRLDSLVEDDFEALNDKKKLERFVKVGIWCIQEDSSLRPTMRKVCQMLEGVVEVLTPSCPSPFL